MLKILLLLFLLAGLLGAGGLFAPQLIEGTDDGCAAAQIKLVGISSQGASPKGLAALTALSGARPDGLLAEDLAQETYGGVPPMVACSLLYFMPSTATTNALNARVRSLIAQNDAAAAAELERKIGTLIQLHVAMRDGVRRVFGGSLQYGRPGVPLVDRLNREAVTDRNIRLVEEGALKDPFGKLFISAQGRAFDIVHATLPPAACQALLTYILGPGAPVDEVGVLGFTTTGDHTYLTAAGDLPLEAPQIEAACSERVNPVAVRYR